MSSKQPHTASASCSSEPLEQGSDGGAGARPPAGAGNASGRQPMVTETAAAISVERVGSAPPDRMRLVFGEHPVQLVSSGRKETYQARYVGTGRTSAMPVVAVFFDDCWAFEKEFEKLELANSLGVGPRVFDVCHREKPQVEDAEGAAFPCLVEEYLGVSLADMIGEDAAAPHIKGGGEGVCLAPIGSDERRQQAAKIAFDIGAELALLHGRGAFYLDLKPSNVCVRAYGEGPADIRAGLIDFETLVTSSWPSNYSTLACYGALCDWARVKGVRAPKLTNRIVDLGFLLLVTACTLCGKTVVALDVEDIDAACKLLGMDFFSIHHGYFDAPSLDEGRLAAWADAAGMTRAQSKARTLPRSTETDLGKGVVPELRESATPSSSGSEMASSSSDAAAAFSSRAAAILAEDDDSNPAFGRFGFCDAVDELRGQQNPLYVLAKRKFDIALACHADWCSAANNSRSDLIGDFFAQDPAKIKQGLRQAGGILDYVARLGCTLVPEQLASLPRYRGQRVGQLDCGQLLLVAQWEHESWRALHEQLGFRYAERNADGTRPDGVNEYLLPWDKLCEKPEAGAVPLPARAPHDEELVKLWGTRARNDIAFACGIVDKLQYIGLAVISEAYCPPSR